MSVAISVNILGTIYVVSFQNGGQWFFLLVFISLWLELACKPVGYVWLPRLSYKRHCSWVLFLLFYVLSLGEASCHVPRTVHKSMEESMCEQWTTAPERTLRMNPVASAFKWLHPWTDNMPADSWESTGLNQWLHCSKFLQCRVSVR
jgi:hypothetical protein